MFLKSLLIFINYHRITIIAKLKAKGILMKCSYENKMLHTSLHTHWWYLSMYQETRVLFRAKSRAANNEVNRVFMCGPSNVENNLRLSDPSNAWTNRSIITPTVVCMIIKNIYTRMIIPTLIPSVIWYFSDHIWIYI